MSATICGVFFDNKQNVGGWGILAPTFGLGHGLWWQTCGNFYYCNTAAIIAPNNETKFVSASTFLLANSRLMHQTKTMLFIQHILVSTFHVPIQNPHSLQNCKPTQDTKPG